MRERTARGHLEEPRLSRPDRARSMRCKRRERASEPREELPSRRARKRSRVEPKAKSVWPNCLGYTGKEKPGGGEVKPSPGLERFREETGCKCWEEPRY